MPHYDLSTPKGQSNYLKSKGLQKLKWYCQVCEKQCRDENGFKCHCNSESHLRRMGNYIQNASRFKYQYSREFESGFLTVLSSLHGEKVVLANVVYQEFIRDRNHTHMNSTAWTTLTGFCNYLASTGKCKIDHDKEGRLTIQFIRRDREALQRKEKEAKRYKDDNLAEQLTMERIQKEIEEAKLMGLDLHPTEGEELDKENVKNLKITVTPKVVNKPTTSKPSVFLNAKDSDSSSEDSSEEESESSEDQRPTRHDSSRHRESSSHSRHHSHSRRHSPHSYSRSHRHRSRSYSSSDSHTHSRSRSTHRHSHRSSRH